MTMPRLAARIPYSGQVTMRDITEVAKVIDDLGYESGWVGSHFAFPEEIKSLNPSTQTGKYPVPGTTPHLEPFAVLNIAASVTSRLRLAVGVCIVPYQAPLELAKIASSLDFLSNGRLIFGAGLGWLEEEFIALGVPYSERLSRLKESIEILRLFWSQDVVEYHGRHWSFGPMVMYPKPVQQPLPIWFGGNVPSALARAGRMGDGWFGSRVPLEKVPAHVKALREAHAASDHADKPFTVMVSRLVSLDGADGNLSVADLSRLRAELEAYHAVGVDVVFVDSMDQTAGNLVPIYERVAKLM